MDHTSMPPARGGLTCDLCGLTGFTKLASHRGKGKCVATRLKEKTSNNLPPQAIKTDILTTLRGLRKSNRVLRRVPKSARHQTAESLIAILDSCVHENDEASWNRLMYFAYSAFSLPDDLENRKISLTTLVKQNLTRPPDLPISMSSAQRAATPTRPNLRKAVMRKMEDGNVSGRGEVVVE